MEQVQFLQDFHKSDKHDPLYILNTFQGFTQAVIHFLKDTGSEPSATMRLLPQHVVIFSFVERTLNHVHFT